MKEIFDSYPNLHLSDVFPTAVLTFPGSIFGLGMVIAVIGMLISLYHLFRSIRNKFKEEKYLTVKEGVLLLLFTMFLTLMFLTGFYQFATDLRDTKGELALEVKEISDWYETNAPLIDKELTAHNYEYIEYEYYPLEPDGKNKMYFDAIGFKPVGLLVVEGVTMEGEVERFNAYIDIVQENKEESNKTLKLKYTSEFGEEYDFGKGVFYGELYVSDFELTKLNATSNHRFR